MNHPDRSPGESPEFLRRTPTEIRAEQSRLLRETLEIAHHAHPYYREQWNESGIDPTAVTGVDDIQALPLTRKTDFMSSPESFRLDLSELAGVPVEKRLLWEVMYTTGTSSGSPSALYTTSHDHFSGLYAARMVAEFHGITERDVVANLYPLTSMPMGAFVRATDLAFAAGASALALFPGKPYPEFDVHRRLDQTIAMVAERRATVLVGVATFMRRFVLRAEELGVDLSSVRRVLLGGEAAPLPIRADIERRLREMGASEVWVTSRYGSTEIGTLPECATGSGWHNPAPDLLYLEIVDDDGNPLPDDTVGQLAVTHLNKTGTVLIRYLVGDVTSINHEPCPHCGRTGGRIVEQPRRVSPLVKVRGMLVNPVLVNQAVATVDGIEDHQVVVDKTDPKDPLSMDSFTVRVIPRGEIDTALVVAIENLVKEAVGITPEIELCRAEDIFDPHARTKPLRFIDRRGEAQTRADTAQKRW